MHPLAKKLMITRQLRMEEDGFILLGNRSLLIPFDIITALDDIIEHSKVYQLGQSAGKEIVSNLKRLGLKAEKLGSFGHDLLSMTGWGKFQLLQMHKNSVIVHVENPLVAKREICHEKCEKRCYFLAGILENLWASSMNVRFVCNETKCMCTGNKICEFVIKT